MLAGLNEDNNLRFFLDKQKIMHPVVSVAVICILITLFQTAQSVENNPACFYGISVNDSSVLYKVCHSQNEYITQSSSTKNVFDTYATSRDMNYLWILIAGAFVFFMQTGFTMLETGMVKHINVQNILFKNVMDACIGTITFFLFGYSIAFGNDEKSNVFMGRGDLALESSNFNSFFFQWAFAATAATSYSLFFFCYSTSM